MESIRTAAAEGLASCHMCGRVSPVTDVHCPRCHSKLHLRKPHSLERTWCYLIAAMAFYLPANLLPIMNVSGLAGNSSDTILSGVFNFWKKGDFLVAGIIFSASAKRMLNRRIDNSPPARGEARWREGWQNRCSTYARPL